MPVPAVPGTGSTCCAASCRCICRQRLLSGRAIFLSQLVKGGKLRALAVADDTRVEAGLPGFNAYVWVEAMIAAKTPAAETARLAVLFAKIEQMPETKAFYGRIGAGVMRGGADEMRALQAAEIQQWRRVVEKVNIPLQ